MNPVNGDFDEMAYLPPTGTGVHAKTPLAMQIGLTGP